MGTSATLGGVLRHCEPFIYVDMDDRTKSERGCGNGNLRTCEAARKQCHRGTREGSLVLGAHCL